MISMQFWTVFIFVAWIYVLWSRRRYYKLLLKIPNHLGYPILGNLPKFWGKTGFITIFGKYFKKYGQTFLFWFGPLPTLVVADPQTMQDIITSPTNPIKSYLAYNLIEQVLGKGLVVLEDAVWIRHRKALNPAFGHTSLMSFIPIFNTETDNLLDKLRGLVGKGNTDLSPITKNLTLKTALQTTIGSNIKKEEIYKNNGIIESLVRLFEAGVQILFKPWLYPNMMKPLSELGRTFMEENIQVRKLIKKFVDTNLVSSIKTENNAFIKLAADLLKNGTFSYQEVEDETYTFLLGAFETSAITLENTLLLLAKYPEYQEKLYEDIKSIFPNTGNFDVTYEDMQKLDYLEMVINETLRLMPTFPIIARKLNMEMKLSNGVVLPKGLQIIFDLFHLQRSKDVWGSKAEIFNPNNCSPENLRKMHPYAFVPFSKGKRSCIGWKYALVSMKVTLIKILRNFKFSSTYRLEDLVVANNITLKFEKSPYVEIELRA